MVNVVSALERLTRLAQTPTVSAVAAAFASADHELALVGGPVRDAFLEKDSFDLDFTTSATPDEIIAVLKPIASTYWEIGREFGTIGGVVKGETVEITTYRADRYHESSRKPEVAFGTHIEEDLRRRDFTINALALRLPELSLVDSGTGIEDLMAGILRTPIDAEESFSDDPLRMLRAARFTSQLGFAVSAETKQAASKLAPRLAVVSAERIRDEFSKLLLTPNPRAGLEFLVETGLAAEFIPELPGLKLESDEHGQHKDVYQHSLTVLEQAIELEGSRGFEPRPDLVLRLAALLHDIGKPSTRKLESDGRVTFYHHDFVGAKLARKRLKELRFEKQHIEQTAELVALHLRFFGYTEKSWTDSAVRRYVRDAGELLERLHILTRSDVTSQNARKVRRLAAAYDDLERRIAELEAEEKISALRPELDGQQIMALLNLAPGPEVGLAYKFLLELRLDEGVLGEEVAGEKLLQWWSSQD
ncbi:MAG: CCA tRNA nucleotidyltransferase [Microbacteriaceae bacterium]